MRSVRPRYPKAKDIAVTTRTLAAVIPMDKPLDSGWRQSERQVPNFRCRSITGGREWYVDIYAGQYFVIGVGDRLTEICHNVPSVVMYLCRMLGVVPNLVSNS